MNKAKKTNIEKTKRGEIIRKIITANHFDPDEALIVQGDTSPIMAPALTKDSAMNFPKIMDDDRNIFHLIGASREGLPYKSLRYAQEAMPFSTLEWAEMMHTSKRTIERIKEKKRKLNITQSEKLIEVTLLFEFGVSVFGSIDKFSKWLTRPNTGLGGIIPKTLFDTTQGIKVVETELSRIEYGVLA